MSFPNDHSFTERFVVYLRALICSDDLRLEFRRSPRNFIRQRMLTFARTLVLLFTGQKMSLQNRVNKFFADLGLTDGSVTATAVLKARDKIRPEVFKRLTARVTRFFYDQFWDYGAIKLYKGRRLVAIDGSVLNVPVSPDIHAEFTVIDNGSDRPYGQALTSYLYDVLQGLPLNAEIGPLQAEKQFLFQHHERFLRPDDILILDRLYADYEVLAWAHQFPGDVIIRCPITNSFKRVEEFAQDPQQTDCLVTLALPARQRRKNPHLPPFLPVRLVKVYLETGEIEVLLTTLLDHEQYPRADFQWLYHQRWGVETYIGQLKHHWDVERVSSGKGHRLKQDYYASVFLTALAVVLTVEAERNLQALTTDQPPKYVYQLNKSVIGATLALTLVKLLLDPTRPLSAAVSFFINLVLKTPVPIRPHRSFERLKTPLRRQLRYLRYTKKLWC